jgi:hypothetical protein
VNYACNTFYFTLVSASFEAKSPFFQVSLLNLHYFCGIFAAEKSTKMYTFPCTIGKCTTNWSKATKLAAGQKQLLLGVFVTVNKETSKLPRSESVGELCQPTERYLSAKLEPNFADGGCHVVIVTDPCGSILGFIDRSRHPFFQVPPQLYSRS